MEKKNKKILLLSVIICLLPMLIGVVLYNKLPEQMPIHFTINDVPDNYAPKNFALFGIPIIMAIVQTICIIATSRISKFQNCEKPKILKILEWFIPIMTVLFYIIMVQNPLGGTVYIGKSVCLILGILFIIIGNYFPKMSYETAKVVMHPIPKTEKSFRKITRIVGYCFIGLGIIFLILIVWV
ncbi:MAG: DUF1648 domain-containing protein [Clostridia bacterium]|nr:DUF1648 domain-containing protein [Clostridia bacterium]